MTLEKAVYNNYDLKNGIKEIQAFPRTTIKKADHYSKLCDLRSMITNNLYPINEYVFDLDYCYYFNNYKKAVESFKLNTKKDMDYLLYLTLINCKRRIESIYNDADAGDLIIKYN